MLLGQHRQLAIDKSCRFGRGLRLYQRQNRDAREVSGKPNTNYPITLATLPSCHVEPRKDGTVKVSEPKETKARRRAKAVLAPA